MVVNKNGQFIMIYLVNLFHNLQLLSIPEKTPGCLFWVGGGVWSMLDKSFDILIRTEITGNCVWVDIKC